MLKALSRYSTQDEAIRAGIEAQRKIGGMNAAKPLTKESTPEEVAAYREAHGIPAEATGYKVELPDGLVVGEADQVVVDSFLKVAHDANISPDVANKIIANQLQLQEAAIQTQVRADADSLAAARAELSSEAVWGREAPMNINLIHSLLDTAPPGVKDQIMGARSPDGTPLANNVPFLTWLASTAREINPVATVTSATGDPMQALNTERGALEKLISDHDSAYWKGPTAMQMQARYRDILEMESKMAAKNKR